MGRLSGPGAPEVAGPLNSSSLCSFPVYSRSDEDIHGEIENRSICLNLKTVTLQDEVDSQPPRDKDQVGSHEAAMASNWNIWFPSLVFQSELSIPSANTLPETE